MPPYTHFIAIFLRLRREDPVFNSQTKIGTIDGAVLGPESLVLRFFGDQGNDRLLLLNLGRDIDCGPVPEPLLAPPEGMRWETLWSSEEPEYGGNGTDPPEKETGWRVPGQSAVVLRPAISNHPKSVVGKTRQ